jgi:hypothetical protein
MKTAVLLAAVTLGISQVAWGQSPTVEPVVVAGGWGPGWYGGYYSSTAAEGALRGWGALAEGAGQYNYLTSLAMINGQIARSQHLDNQVKYAQTYWEKKDIYRQNTQSTRRPLSAEDYQRLAKDRAPERLDGYQFERATGQIHWPAALQGPEFVAERTRLEALFAQRDVRDSGPGSPTCREIQATTERMLTAHRQQLGQLSPTEYIHVKKFLQGLALEAHQPVVPLGLATR